MVVRQSRGRGKRDWKLIWMFEIRNRKLLKSTWNSTWKSTWNDENESEVDPSSTEVRRKFDGKSSKNCWETPYCNSLSTVWTWQVRGKDVSFPYHHALTVSSLGSDCQACTAPLPVKFHVEMKRKLANGISKGRKDLPALSLSNCNWSRSCHVKNCSPKHRVPRCFHTHTHWW